MKSKLKKSLSLLLALAMVLSCMSMSAFAEGTDNNETYAAQIGDVKYATLAEAVAAAHDDDTITLLANCETGVNFGPTAPMILNANNATLDLNGKVLTITKNMSLVIRSNNGVVKNGTIEPGLAEGSDDDWCRYGLTIDSCTGLTIEHIVSNTGIAIGGDPDDYTPNAGAARDVTMTDCTVKGLSSRYAVFAQNGSNVIIESGTYTHEKGENGGVLYATKATDGGVGTIAVTGGNFTGTINHGDSTSNVVITGGDFTADPTAYVPSTHEVVKSTVSGYNWTVQPWFGSGTKDDPYLIETADDLIALATAVNNGNSFSGVYFAQTGRIDLTGKTWNSIGSIKPGSGSIFSGHTGEPNRDDPDWKPFSGTYKSNTTSKRGIVGLQSALFGATENATIRDIAIYSPQITKNGWFAGAIADYAYNSSFASCTVDGSSSGGEQEGISIQGTHFVGGAVGYASDSKFNNVMVTGANGTDNTISATIINDDDGDDVGGLVGYAVNGITTTGCTVKQVTIKAARQAGGLIGHVNGGDNKDKVKIAGSVSSMWLVCTATGAIFDGARDKIAFGGLVGNLVNVNSSSTISGTVGGTAGSVRFYTDEDANISADNKALIRMGYITGGLYNSNPFAGANATVTATVGDCIRETGFAPIPDDKATIDGDAATVVAELYKAGVELPYAKATSLKAAVNDADNDTIRIADGVEEAALGGTLNGKTATLDLNGATITGTGYLTAYKGCNLTITGNGTLTGKGSNGAIKMSKVNGSDSPAVTIENGTISSISFPNFADVGTLTVKGGYIGSFSTPKNATKITITGGTFGFDPTAYVAPGYVAKEIAEGEEGYGTYTHRVERKVVAASDTEHMSLTDLVIDSSNENAVISVPQDTAIQTMNRTLGDKDSQSTVEVAADSTVVVTESVKADGNSNVSALTVKVNKESAAPETVYVITDGQKTAAIEASKVDNKLDKDLVDVAAVLANSVTGAEKSAGDGADAIDIQSITGYSMEVKQDGVATPTVDSALKTALAAEDAITDAAVRVYPEVTVTTKTGNETTSYTYNASAESTGKSYTTTLTELPKNVTRIKVMHVSDDGSTLLEEITNVPVNNGRAVVTHTGCSYLVPVDDSYQGTAYTGEANNKTNSVYRVYMNLQESLILNYQLYLTTDSTSPDYMGDGKIVVSFDGVKLGEVTMSSLAATSFNEADMKVAVAKDGFYCARYGANSPWYYVSFRVYPNKMGSGASVELFKGNGDTAPLYENVGATTGIAGAELQTVENNVFNSTVYRFENKLLDKYAVGSADYLLAQAVIAYGDAALAKYGA